VLQLNSADPCASTIKSNDGRLNRQRVRNFIWHASKSWAPAASALPSELRRGLCPAVLVFLITGLCPQCELSPRSLVAEPKPGRSPIFRWRQAAGQSQRLTSGG